MRKRVGVERLVAALIDNVFLGIIVFIPTTIFTLLYIGIDNIFDSLLNTAGTMGGSSLSDPISLIVLAVIEVVIGVVYFAYIPYKKNGQTFGKMVLRLKVIDELGENPGFKAHFIRAIQVWTTYLTTIALVTLFFGFMMYSVIVVIIAVLMFFARAVAVIMLLARTDERGIHDLMADTMVVKVDENLNRDFIDKTTQMSEWAKVVDEEDEFEKLSTEDPLNPKDDEW